MLPSDRLKVIDRSRHKRKTVLIYRCRRCGARYDAVPMYRFVYATGTVRTMGCPGCGADGMWIVRARVPD